MFIFLRFTEIIESKMKSEDHRHARNHTFCVCFYCYTLSKIKELFLILKNFLPSQNPFWEHCSRVPQLFPPMITYLPNRPPQSETVPARIFRFFMCLRQKTPLSLCSCHFQCQTLLFLFFSLPNLFRFICLLPSNVSFNTSNTIQIVFLAIVPGKLEMCLQENLVDCTDCGGLL